MLENSEFARNVENQDSSMYEDDQQPEAHTVQKPGANKSRSGFEDEVEVLPSFSDSGDQVMNASKNISRLFKGASIDLNASENDGQRPETSMVRRPAQSVLNSNESNIDMEDSSIEGAGITRLMERARNNELSVVTRPAPEAREREVEIAPDEIELEFSDASKNMQNNPHMSFQGQLQHSESDIGDMPESSESGAGASISRIMQQNANLSSQKGNVSARKPMQRDQLGYKEPSINIEVLSEEREEEFNPMAETVHRPQSRLEESVG